MATATRSTTATPLPVDAQSDAGRSLYGKMTDLRCHYQRKHAEANNPFKDLLLGVAIVVSVAAAVFSSFVGMSAFLFGVGIFAILTAVSMLLVRSSSSKINQEAADALLSPGFFEHMQQEQKQLASAEKIVAAHKAWLAA